MSHAQVHEIHVTPGEYEALMRLTTPHDCQQPHIVELRHALENAERRSRPHLRYVLSDMTLPMLQGAVYVLQINTVRRTKAATLQLNRFRRTYGHLLRTP
ncbi:hypothetical protein [Streptomyces sp. NPDC059783]|uniref:hypothetical protein n=1 Tax=Streptomyces sp. NPDC059783 TaxID=3346944 RepID=UPI0036515CED